MSLIQTLLNQVKQRVSSIYDEKVNISQIVNTKETYRSLLVCVFVQFSWPCLNWSGAMEGRISYRLVYAYLPYFRQDTNRHVRFTNQTRVASTSLVSGILYVYEGIEFS